MEKLYLTCLFTGLVCNALGAQYTWVSENTDWGSYTYLGDSVSANPSETMVGTDGYSITSKIAPSSTAYAVGSAIVFQGDVTLVLGDGLSPVTLQFNTGNTGPKALYPAPGSLPESGLGTFFDYNCPFNWKINNPDGTNGDVTPKKPPFIGDTAQFQPGATYFATTRGQLAGASQVNLGSLPAITQGCGTNGILTNSITDTIVNVSDVSGGTTCSQWKWPSYSGTAKPTSSCDLSNAVQLSTTISGGDVSTSAYLFTSGPRKGKLYEEITGTEYYTLPVATGNSFKIQQNTPGVNDTTYIWFGVKVTVSNGVATIVTAQPTTAAPLPTTAAPPPTTAAPPGGPNSGSTSDSNSSSSGGGMGIIAGAAAAVVLVIVVVIIVLKKKGGDGGRAPPVRSEGVGFENPLYDAAGNETGGGGGSGNDGLYSESVNFEDPSYNQQDMDGGYSDLPGQGGSNYADLPAGGAGGDGYLDVDPDLDGFGDSDSE